MMVLDRIRLILLLGFFDSFLCIFFTLPHPLAYHCYNSLMKIVLILILLALGSAQAHECKNPISTHLKEAIAHNKKAAKIYSKLSEGESEQLSYTLITLEHISILISNGVEREARPYHQNNIPLLCEEIPSMDGLPAFQERLPVDLRPQTFFKYDRKSLSQELTKLMDQNRFDEAYDLVAVDLNKLEAAPNQLCLTRHFLESIALTLKLATSHRDQAIAAGLPDPVNVIKKYIELQRRALFLTAHLDKQAFPLQKDGLLIFCQDVPAIDWK